tara:strand:- start:67 stop:306 length:240 start_codon:yes stop_codon:yes gene_type:complete
MKIITYKNMTDSYNVNNIIKNKPSAVNFLSYRKYEITIEEIDEPKSVLIDRLKSMITPITAYNKKSMINEEIKRLEQLP